VLGGAYHHENVNALESSVRDGCQLCEMMLAGFSDDQLLVMREKNYGSCNPKHPKFGRWEILPEHGKEDKENKQARKPRNDGMPAIRFNFYHSMNERNCYTMDYWFCGYDPTISECDLSWMNWSRREFYGRRISFTPAIALSKLPLLLYYHTIEPSLDVKKCLC
jgi:hypothetical protein